VEAEPTVTLTIQQAIERVPFLAHAENVEVTPLSGGITNLNYRIDADGKAYVLRITGADTHLLGIRRDVEYTANLAAGEMGIAPEVVYSIEPEGYLVTRFVDGVRIPQDDMVKPENIRRIAMKLREFHERGPHLAAEFNVFRRVEMLTEISLRNGCRFPRDFGWMMRKMHETEKLFNAHHPFLKPCHNDLLNLNFLDEHGEVRILDWEYAGMGDIFFDLANFSHHHEFGDDQVRILLQEYFGSVAPKAFAGLKLMWPMSEMHEAMWGTTQTGISKLDEDFQGYADLWFGRAAESMQDPRWEQWRRDLAEGR
jgi:thiamine kinase-like enzyme